jgi:effector-binding domain-containing protein
MLIKGIRKKTAKAFTYLQGSKTVTYEKVPEAGGKLMEGLQKLMRERGVAPAGPAVWSYRHAGKGKVALRSGFPVKTGTRGKAPFQARAEPEWECLSARFQGSMLDIIAAWHELFDAAEKKGLECSDERREIYLKWIRFDSKENVTELQVRLSRK